MAENTEHYNLVKPDYADAADVSQLNDNMDTIDGILWQLANAGADEELLKKVQEILDKIGETADTGGSTTLGSVMAKLNEILKKAGSGTTGKTIIQILEELLQQPKIIKHIQRGTASFAHNTKSLNIVLSGFTNLGKMVVILNGVTTYVASGNVSVYLPYITELSLTSLSLAVNVQATNAKTISYQVIEFC